MKRSPLYSSSGSKRRGRAAGSGWAPPPVAGGPDFPPEKTLRQAVGERWSAFHRRFEKPLAFAASIAVSLALVAGFYALQPKIGRAHV